MEPEVKKLDETISKIEEAMMKIPFEVLQVEEIEAKLKTVGFDHFIDPCFPPKDVSIYNNLQMAYPYK
jgi:hypothetical protein